MLESLQDSSAPHSVQPHRTGRRSRTHSKPRRRDIGSEVKHHEMAGVLLAHQPTGEKGKTRLHEEYKVPCNESPVEVGRNPNVPDGIGKLTASGSLAACSLYSWYCFFFSA